MGEEELRELVVDEAKEKEDVEGFYSPAYFGYQSMKEYLDVLMTCASISQETKYTINSLRHCLISGFVNVTKELQEEGFELETIWAKKK